MYVFCIEWAVYKAKTAKGVCILEILEIDGRAVLRGTAKLCGAKNSILPLLAASLLTDGRSVFRNVPNLTDVTLACEILAETGVQYKRYSDVIEIEVDNAPNSDVPRELMEGMRGSFIFLGSLLGRHGKAAVFMPGGCKLGLRPVDIHIDALGMLGAKFEIERDHFVATVPNKRLKGAEINLRYPSVGATENILLAAVTAEGTTKITNAAREPEITDLARYLNRCGADINNAGEATIIINGTETLHGAEHTVIPDRILATTLFSAAAITKSCITVENIDYDSMSSILKIYGQCGLKFKENGATLHVDASNGIESCRKITCDPHPGFPTDAGPLLAAMMCFGNGKSEIYDTVFENRFGCCCEFAKFGADAAVVGRSAIINKVCRDFTAARVTARDLRGGAALICMALGSTGTSTLSGLHHVDRGYSAIETTLSGLGASVRRKRI